MAGALILYPRYLDPLTRLPCGPEVIIDRLDRPELWRPGPVVLARRLQGMVARRLAEVRAMLPIAGLLAGARAARAAAPLMRGPYRVIVITGASSGLGASLALAYAGPQTALGVDRAETPTGSLRPPPPAARPARRSRPPRSMSPTGASLANWLDGVRPRLSGRAG